MAISPHNPNLAESNGKKSSKSEQNMSHMHRKQKTIYSERAIG
jgi:hypothetical protein